MLFGLFSWPSYIFQLPISCDKRERIHSHALALFLLSSCGPEMLRWKTYISFIPYRHLKHELIYATGHLLSADIKMIKLKDVTGDKCWPFNLPQFTASSIFIPDHWGLKCCINGRGAVQHYESRGQYIEVFSFSIILPAVVGKERNVPLFCPLLFEQRDVKECTS